MATDAVGKTIASHGRKLVGLDQFAFDFQHGRLMMNRSRGNLVLDMTVRESFQSRLVTRVLFFSKRLVLTEDQATQIDIEPCAAIVVFGVERQQRLIEHDGLQHWRVLIR